MVEDCAHAGLLEDGTLGDRLLVSPAGHPFWDFLLRRIRARAPELLGNAAELPQLAGAPALTAACGMWLADRWDARYIEMNGRVVGGLLEHGDWVLWKPEILRPTVVTPNGRAPAPPTPEETSAPTSPASPTMYNASPPRVLIGVCTCLPHAEHRQAVRETWAAMAGPEQTVRFFLGASAPLPDEPDAICLPVEDSYEFLPKKVMAFFRHVLEHFQFDWIFKCDDDTYVDLTRLPGLVGDDCDLVGNDILENRGFPSGGAGYLLSKAMVERLVADGRIPDEGSEDRLIGHEAIRLGARARVSKQLIWNKARFPRGENGIVTSHWCRPERLRAIHVIRHTLPQRQIEVQHPRWSDRLNLYADGVFVRCSTDCAGFFEKDGSDLVLRWFDWPEERVSPGRGSPRRQGTGMGISIRAGVSSITVELMGGMGNQMFQYAHGMALADASGARLRVVAGSGCRFALGDFGIAADVGVPATAERIVFMGGVHSAEWPTGRSINHSGAEDFVISGYFQNEGYFRSVAAAVRRLFALSAVSSSAPPGCTPVCVHVRRGDFAGSATHDLCTAAYYIDAMRQMREWVLKPWFVVVSDDPGWCERHFAEQGEISVLPRLERAEAFRVMLGCEAFVLSNSSFSWWAAWLADRKPVIAPDQWIRGKQWDICPDDWHLHSPGGLPAYHLPPKTDPRILEHGQWSGEISAQHVYDPGLAAAIAKLLKEHGCAEVWDLGCGQGRYVAAFIEAGIRAHGIDGHPDTAAITGGRCTTADLAGPLELGKRDAVVSLEVGEHIPAQFEQVVLDNIAGLANKLVVLSWAVPGQGGLGHVNCRTNEAIEDEMRLRGFVRSREAEAMLRRVAAKSWFKKSLMVYVPTGATAYNPKEHAAPEISVPTPVAGAHSPPAVRIFTFSFNRLNFICSLIGAMKAQTRGDFVHHIHLLDYPAEQLNFIRSVIHDDSRFVVSEYRNLPQKENLMRILGDLPLDAEYYLKLDDDDIYIPAFLEAILRVANDNRSDLTSFNTLLRYEVLTRQATLQPASGLFGNTMCISRGGLLHLLTRPVWSAHGNCDGWIDAALGIGGFRRCIYSSQQPYVLYLRHGANIS